MDLSDEFQHLSLRSFESDAPGTDYSFAGLSVASQVTAVLESSESGSEPSDTLGVERFFEVCFDAGVEVHSETEFEKGLFLGSGATMNVYKGVWKERGQAVALKYFKNALWACVDWAKPPTIEYQHWLEACMLELQVLSSDPMKRHENIARLLAVSWNSRDGNIYPILVMELACEEHPTMAQLLSKPKPLVTRLELILDVLEGLSALHGLSVVYGDIKPENILIFRSSSTAGITAKLSDFGFCKPTKESQWEAGGTPYWNAPECLFGSPNELKTYAYSNGRDIYALGLLASYVITEDMPFSSLNVEEISELKLSDKVAALMSSKWKIIEHPSAQTAVGSQPECADSTAVNYTWEILKTSNGIWHRQSERCPFEFLAIVSRTLLLQPSTRPSIQEIRNSLIPYTSKRREPARIPPKEIQWQSSVLGRQFMNARYGVGEGLPEADLRLDETMPANLKDALYKRLLTMASRGNRIQRAQAMNRLGVFFLNAFGTSKSFHEAFNWFCRAAEHGSVQAKKMVFRMERAMKNAAEPLHANITTETRTNWMVDCLLEHTKSGFDPRLSPNSLDFGRIDAQIRDIFASIDRYALWKGLCRDIDNNVVRLMCTSGLSKAAVQTRQQVENMAHGSALLQPVLDKVYEDDAEALDALLSRTNSLTEGFKNRLVTVAADRGAKKVLKTLILKHGANPNHIDKTSGRELPSVLDAAIRNDYPTMVTLADCGADLWLLITRGVMDRVIRAGDSAVMGMCLTVLQAKKVASDNENLFGTSSLCHQFLDGICPVMNEMFHVFHGKDGTPPDVTDIPPLFVAVMFNNLDKIHALLAKGADPNVRAEGMNAIHIAVRCLHPTALLFLLAFGANPNSRNSKEGYTTPLHALSEPRLKIHYDSRGYEYGLMEKDFLLRDYEPLPEEEAELRYRRSLLIRILLEYGADPKTHCIDGFTPLMTAMVNPADESGLIFHHLLEAKVSIDDRSSRDETLLHICVLAKDVVRLREVLSTGGTRQINAKDISSCTPLFLAAQQEDSSNILKTLLDHGADINSRGILDLSPLDVALIEGRADNISILLNHAGSLPQSDLTELLSGSHTNGRSPIHICLAMQDTDLASKCLDRLLQLASSASYTLLTFQDRFGRTPIDYAHLRNNKSAIRIIAHYFVPKAFHPLRISYPSSQQIRKKIPDAEKLLNSFNEYRSSLNNLMRVKVAERNRCYDACEFTGPHRSLTPVEIGYETCLKEYRHRYGDDDPRAVWCMNNLGTVYERYGRLQKAQDIHYQGWKQALNVFSHKSPVTQDFARKFLRVIRDRGLQGTEGHDVAEWHTSHGCDTLEDGGMAFIRESEFEDLTASDDSFDAASKSSTNSVSIQPTPPDVGPSRPPIKDAPKTPILRPAVESWPVVLETPTYKVKVSIYHHLMARRILAHDATATTDLNCWTYISANLHPMAGGEVVLSVRRRDNDREGAYPMGFRSIYDKIYAITVRNQTKLRRWQLIEFQEPLFERQDFHMIVLGFRNIPLFGLEELQLDKSPISYYYALVLTDEEAAVARKYGLTRALVVGEGDSGWFPYPFYVDRDRKSGASLTTMEGSASGNGIGTKLDVPGLNVIQAKHDVHLHIPEGRVEAFKKSIISKRATRFDSLMIESEMHESCDSVYIWQPGGPARIRYAGLEDPRSTAMNFLLLCPNQSVNAVKVIEDGCVVSLTPQYATSFFGAAISGLEFTLPSEGTSFHLSWPPWWPRPVHAYISGGATDLYYAPNGSSSKSSKRSHAHVSLEKVFLLHAPQNEGANAEWTAYCLKMIDDIVASTIPVPKPAALPSGCGIIIQLRIPKIDQGHVKIGVSTIPPQEDSNAIPVAALYEAIDKLPLSDGLVYRDYFEIMLWYSCWGFKGPYIPRSSHPTILFSR